MRLLNRAALIGLTICTTTLGCSAPTEVTKLPGDNCPTQLLRSTVNASVDLGAQFLLANQLPEGNFAYEYDWLTRSDSKDDHQVRQAGAAWGVSLLYQHENRADYLAASLRALSYFESHSKLNQNNNRFIAYPGAKQGDLGTIALVALAHIELLRTDLEPTLRQQLDKRLDEYLGFLLESVTEEGRFRAHYSLDGGESYGKPTPYYEGEALLALSKAAHRLNKVDLLPLIRMSAAAGFQANVRDALAKDRDSSTTKGYYQWSSMSYHEFRTAEWEELDIYGSRLVALGKWMIIGHRVLKRELNTGYAYEGLIPSLVEAQRVGDEEAAAMIECTIHQGLGKLISLQVGGPTPNEYISNQPTNDPRALGGIQNHPEQPGLRIDVAQHQTHALILALRHLNLTQE